MGNPDLYVVINNKFIVKVAGSAYRRLEGSYQDGITIAIARYNLWKKEYIEEAVKSWEDYQGDQEVFNIAHNQLLRDLEVKTINVITEVVE